MCLSIFGTQNWIKGFRKGRNFPRAVSFLFIVVLLVRKVKILLWIPVVRHICSVIKFFFVELHDVSSKICVKANNSVSPVKGQSVATTFLLDKRGVSHVLNLSNCLYVSDHSQNLLSVSALGQKGAKFVVDDTCELRSSHKVYFPSFQRNDLYVTKAFQFVLQTFLAPLKLILIFSIADWVTILSSIFKSCQSRLKE